MNQYDRLKKIIGDTSINKLMNLSVLLVGLGGVGGSCFESLVRSAIGNIYVCDYDVFEESNLNRQVLSNMDNLGIKKTAVARLFASKINPFCKITEINHKLTEETVDDILPCNIDYIIDACDDVKVKIKLVKFAMKHSIKIISCMGTGNKLNPQKLEITNIWKTNYDPLAKKIRQLLKKEHINYKLPVVSSYEESLKCENGKVGSFSPVVNTAGLLLASYVINDAIKNKEL